MSIQKINRKSKPFLVRCRDIDGKQISATFATRSEAEAFQNEHAKEKSLPDDIQISGMDRSDFVRIRQLCNDFNITLADVYSITKKSLENRKRESVSIIKAKDLFIDYCKRKRLRARTCKGYKGHLNRFVKWCESMNVENVEDVSKNNAQLFIAYVGNQERIRATLRVCWSFLLEMNFAESNVFKNIKMIKVVKDKSEIEFLSVKQTKENINALPEEYKPLYALLTFAGIRPEEIISDNSEGAKLDYLSFKDIDFKRKRITIRPSVSKTREVRYIEGIPNLFKWLEPIKEWKAIIPQGASYCRWITQKKLLPHVIPHDALRHSFATHAYYFFGVEKAVDILGHDYKTYKKHYKGLTTPAECKKYFKIVP